MPALTVGYFWNDYGGASPEPFLRSIAKVYPHAQTINCAVPCKPQVAMACRAQCYAKLRHKVRGNLMLLDTDIEAVQPAEIWHDDFDIGLTITSECTPLMPYNGGVIFAKDTLGAADFLNEVSRCANIVPEDFGPHFWYIDQLALGYVAKSNRAVRIFNDDYNYIPRSPDDRPETACFIHYKGKRRKAWQPR